MPRMTFDSTLVPVVDRALLARAGVRKAKAFGMPGYYVGNKLAACVWEDGLTLKLPAAMAQDLLRQGLAAPFEPMPGRAMREWVLLRAVTPELLRSRADWIEAAIDYVASVATAAPKGPAPKRPAAQVAAQPKRPAAKSAPKPERASASKMVKPAARRSPARARQVRARRGPSKRT